jgi:uncharacterized protein
MVESTGAQDRRGQDGSPIPQAERSEALDALRGFALLGIFISHIPDFSGYSFMTSAHAAALDRFGLDHAAATVQDFLIRGKFYSLFSLLFGIGFAVQLESAGRRGGDFSRHFTRRLSVLFVIGLVHASLWYGDILKDYALLGFLLIPLRGAKPAVIAWAGGFVFALRLGWPSLIAWLAPMIWRASPGHGADAGFTALTGAFNGSDLTAAFAANFELVRIKALQMIYDGRALSVLCMFLLGALAGKLGLHRNISAHRNLYARLFLICAPVGLLGNAWLTPLHAATPEFPPSSEWVIEYSLYAVAVPAMAVAYASGFAWLWSSGWRAALACLAPSGRMALTTYVIQTLIGITLFYGIGLGLHGQIGLVEGALLAIAIFAAQCVVASLWLRWFYFGPLEWVWRRFTYAKPIAFVVRERGAPSRADA